jgi:hypothetical protein
MTYTGWVQLAAVEGKLEPYTFVGLLAFGDRSRPQHKL